MLAFETRFALAWALSAEDFAERLPLSEVSPILLSSAKNVLNGIVWKIDEALDAPPTFLSARIVWLMSGRERSAVPPDRLAALRNRHQSAFGDLLKQPERATRRTAIRCLLDEGRFALLAMDASRWLDFVSAEVEANHWLGSDGILGDEDAAAYGTLLERMCFAFTRQRNAEPLIAAFRAAVLLRSRTEPVHRAARFLSQQFSERGGLQSDEVAFHLASDADGTTYDTQIVFRMSASASLGLIDYLGAGDGH